MQGKRRPIRKQVQTIVLLISVVSLLLTSLIGTFSMLKIKNDSEASLVSQVEQHLNSITNNKASLANAALGKFSGYVGDFAAYIHDLYSHPDRFVPKEVLPPDADNAGIYSMQRYLATEDMDYEDVAEEISLLGNLEHIWEPVISDNGSLISTIYVGTETGFHIAYDPRADLGVMEGSYESYYDYFDSSWYTDAKEASGPIFTEMYQDGYGRGLTISCVSPFFDADGQFAGAVCMDILVTSLHTELVDVDLGEGTLAFLVEQDGTLITSPYLTWSPLQFTNILDDANPDQDVVSSIMAGESGVSLTENGVYYAYTPIPSANWNYCIYVPEDTILAPVDAMNQDIVLTMLVFLASFAAIILVVFWTARWFSKKLSEPLVTLGKDVETISCGNLDHQAQIQSNDEIGDLATGFNNMAHSLKEYIENLTAVTAEKERIGAELDVATHIQSSMLPCIFPAFPDRPEIDIYATMTPAKEVGGDFYDFFMVDDRHLAIVMADVSGKGVPAALFMVIGKTLIKDHTQPGRDLGEVFTEVNNLLCESNSEGLFITAFEGVLDLVTGEFRFVNAGHEMPFISRKAGAFEPHKIRPGFVLAGMEGIRYRAGSLTLEPGDKVFQYTDGVTEATSEQEELYGMARLQNILASVADRKPEDILPAVKADIDAFVGAAPQFDDITMLCLEYKARMESDPEVEV